MKKYLSVLLAVAMIFCLAACGDSGEQQSADPGKTMPTFAIVASDTTGDRGFVDMSYEGIQKAAKDFGIEWKFFSCNNDASIYLDTMKAAAENYDVIFVVPGYFYDNEIAEVSALYPDKTFVYIDGTTDMAGVVSCSFMQNEGAFLAGVLAANLTESGKVGFLGGADMAVIHDYQIGFEEGVAYANTGANVIVRYTNDHYDPALGKETAKASYEEGADVIFQAAGPAGLGVLEAAEEYGFIGIGVDTDQGYIHPNCIASSMLKRVDTAVYDIVSKAISGEELPAVNVYNVANAGISLADNEYYQAMVSPEIRDVVKAATEAVASGSVKVSSYFN